VNGLDRLIQQKKEQEQKQKETETETETPKDILSILKTWSLQSKTKKGYRYLLCWTFIRGLGIDSLPDQVHILYGGTSNSCANFQFTGSFFGKRTIKTPKINLYVFRATQSNDLLKPRLFGGKALLPCSEVLSTTPEKDFPGFVAMPWEWVDFMFSSEEIETILARMIKRYSLNAKPIENSEKPKMNIKAKLTEMFEEWGLDFRNSVPEEQHSMISQFWPKDCKPGKSKVQIREEHIFLDVKSQENGETISIDSILESRLCGTRESEKRALQMAGSMNVAGKHANIPLLEELTLKVDEFCFNLVLRPHENVSFHIQQLETSKGKITKTTSRKKKSYQYCPTNFQIFPEILQDHWDSYSY
jgi:hypothetical protein